MVKPFISYSGLMQIKLECLYHECMYIAMEYIAICIYTGTINFTSVHVVYNLTVNIYTYMLVHSHPNDKCKQPMPPKLAVCIAN